MKKSKDTQSFSLPLKVILILLPVVTGVVSLCTGRMYIPLKDVMKEIANMFGTSYSLPHEYVTVIKSIRLPRILLAILVGSGLSVSGAVYQSLFANPLATPDTLGVASGASFGAVLGILLGFNLVGIQFLAIISGLFAVILTVLSAKGRKSGFATVVLAGIMISSLFSGLISLVKFTADTETKLPAITFWLMGSLSGVGYKSLMFGAPLIVICIMILTAMRWRLNILPLPDDEAAASGTNIKMLRAVTVICATVITASCVSMCGQVGWVGLLVPHICRMKFGSNHMRLIPSSVSIGASFMLIVDTLARSISASEIPVSVLTAIIGAPFFIFLMRKKGGWQL